METKLDIWSIYIWGRVNRERGKGEGNATDTTEWWGIFPILSLQHPVTETVLPLSVGGKRPTHVFKNELKFCGIQIYKSWFQLT